MIREYFKTEIYHDEQLIFLSYFYLSYQSTA